MHRAVIGIMGEHAGSRHFSASMSKAHPTITVSASSKAPAVVDFENVFIAETRSGLAGWVVMDVEGWGVCGNSGHCRCGAIEWKPRVDPV